MSIKNDVTGKQVWDGIRMLKGTGFKVVSVIKYDKNGVRNVVGYLPGKACIVQVRVSEDEYFLRLDGQVRKECASVKIIESFQPFDCGSYNGNKSSKGEGSFSASVAEKQLSNVQKILSNFIPKWVEKLEDSFQGYSFRAWFTCHYYNIRDGAFPKAAFRETNERVLAKIPEEMFIRKDGSKVRVVTQ